MRKKLRNGYNDNTKPIEDTSYKVHETILGLIDGGRGKALDMGAGFGLLSDKLRGMGFDVTAYDLDQKRIDYVRKMGIRCDKIDLNAGLPYKSEIFDLVVSSDVIEHTRSPYNFVHEIGRVLKKGGCAVLSTPNILNWCSRLKFLSSGMYNNYFTDKDFRGEGYHISPIHFSQMRWMLRQAGMEIENVTANQYTGLVNLGNPKIFVSSLAMLPLRLFMKPNDKALLEGDILIVKARKVIR